ncbi:pilin [bacterium]|nr:pilin [bacterium]
MKKILATLATYPVLALSTISAAGLIDPGEITSASGTLGDFVKNALNFAVGTAAVACVAILIASGYMYITAAGDEAKVEKATKSLTFAIIGLVICFIAVMLVNFVLSDILGQPVTK